MRNVFFCHQLVCVDIEQIPSVVGDGVPPVAPNPPPDPADTDIHVD